MQKEICWNITSRCNQNCKYCHRFQNIKELKKEENFIILNKLCKLGIKSITWTGGEALLYDGIDELLEYSYNNGIKNKLISNGRLLTNERIDKIYKYLDSITLSIDSVDSNTNAFLGRGKNHFNNIKSILDYIKLKEYNIKIQINSVICKTNLEQIDGLIEFLNKYNIYSWRIFKFMPLREKAIISKEVFDVSLDKYLSIVDKIAKKSYIKNIDKRIEMDMENKYILILANGDIVITNNGKDKRIGNILIDKF